MIRQTTTAPVTQAAVITSSGLLLNIVPTYAALKALPVAQRVGTVIVLGKFAKADGGGGIWCWEATDTRADNGTTVLVPT